jgi:AraC family transcriptional regulator
LICQLRAEAVHKCLPEDFAFSDRRLEACLDVSNTTIQNLLLRLARELQNPGVKSAALAEAISVQLAIEAARYLIAVSDDAVTGGLASWRLRVIDKRLTQEGPSPTLPELATLCNLSVRQLTRAFRTSRGSSIGDFMAQSRIEMAKRRLMSEGCVKAVANSMGFSSQSTFTYAFRRATGVTPGQFRTHALRADESPISSLRA